MKLTFNDRIAIIYGAILPQSASVANMIIAKTVKSKAGFIDAELLELNLVVQPNGAVTYRASKSVDNYSIDVEFTDEELNLLNEGAKRIDEAEQVTADMLDTVVKFMPV